MILFYPPCMHVSKHEASIEKAMPMQRKGRACTLLHADRHGIGMATHACRPHAATDMLEEEGQTELGREESMEVAPKCALPKIGPEFPKNFAKFFAFPVTSNL
jgi:hypothetical protein